MKSFLKWLREQLSPDSRLPVETPAAFDVGALVTRIGDCEWKVTLQIRQPSADYDAVYGIRWLGENPPNIDEVLRAYAAHPECFLFLDFVPNPKKK
jgi:hypothetical protein